eukprot:scaffold6007_cov183-Amphora_coffeaeformis.AAC.30
MSFRASRTLSYGSIVDEEEGLNVSRNWRRLLDSFRSDCPSPRSPVPPASSLWKGLRLVQSARIRSG